MGDRVTAFGMLKFDLGAKTLSPLTRSSMAESNILERGDLQQAIRGSWEAFRNEMGMPELILLGEEIQPCADCKDRIDLLALDSDGHLVIIELKRGRERLQLMQAIAYAGMVAQWDAQELRQRVPMARVPQAADVEDLLASPGGVKFGEPRIVLLAELYDPEVIIGAHWLSRYDVPITAYTASLLTLEGSTFLAVQQRYPLPELKDVYVSRSRSGDVAEAETGWKEVLPQLKLAWAEHAITLLCRLKAGDPVRRRFVSLFSDGPFGGVQMNIGQHHVKVYTYNQSEEQAAGLRAALGSTPFTTWGSEQTANSGYTFALKTQFEFDRFVAAASAPTKQAP